jgi:hypothetical protein
MDGWEYSKIDLNDLPHKAKDIDLLNNAGAEGWEIVTITANLIAYLRRQVKGPTSRPSRAKVAQSPNNGVAGK